ncbi:MAG: FG-GAP-like repeat-containing protein, partial [Flavobacteriales bacterium]
PMQNYTFMAIWMDYDRDLYPDLFVTNDRFEVPNYFYHNNGDGTFTEIAAALNLDDYLFSMTATSDDYDNDGDLDVYITNGTSGNYHKRNDGAAGFADVNEQQGTTLNRFCWNALFVDANRDGWQDLHVCSTPHITLPGQNFLYLNTGESFTLANDSAGIASDDGWSRSAAMGDFNNDGLADLAICKGMPSYSAMWRAMPNANNWLKVTLEGVESNKDGVGSWIDCYSGLGMQSRYTFCGEGYLAQNSFSEFFGLGSQSLVDSLVVHWPSGVIDRWYRIPANQQLFLVEGTSRLVTLSPPDGLILCSGDTVTIALNEWTAYEWNSGEETQVVQTSEPGHYTAAVTDEWGNVFLADSALIVQAEIPTVNVQLDSVSCFNFSDAGVYANADMAVEFSLNGTTSATGEFTGLHTGLYVLSWVDENGCGSSQQLLIEEPEPLVASAQITNVSCHGEADGAVLLTISGGSPGYEIQSGSSPLAQLSAGNYEYYIVDANGCS